MLTTTEEQKLNRVSLLTIQKIVKLLSPRLLQEFKNYLVTTRSKIPLKLIDTIERTINEDINADELCKMVYGRNDVQTRKSFNQLASHTFKLTSFLSKNYPGYLYHNITELEVLINDGKLAEGNLLAEITLDIAEKINDNHTQILVLKFLAQQAQMHKAQAETLKIHEKIQKLLEVEQTINNIYYYIRKNLNISVKDDSVLHSFDKHYSYFNDFKLHENITIRLLSKYAIFYLLYYYRPTEFLTEKIQQKIQDFDDELNKNSVSVLPFMEDIFSKFVFYRLNLSTTDLNSIEGKAEYQKLLSYNKHLKFWQNYVNVPELYAIAIKSTYYLSRYHSINHRNDFREVIPLEDKLDIAKLTKRCEELIKKDIWEPNHITDLVHFRLTWSALLLLGDKAEVLKGISNLELLMTTYQQITFSESMDSIFICLMIGYFTVNNYKMSVETYKRYIKLARGRVVNSENDIEIHTYYYCSQWLLSERNQYLNKIVENYQRAGKHNGKYVLQQTILELVNYFKIPVKLTD
jgi:hypothetical protein